jgi:acyl-CoA synthetase (NDP forming)
VIAVPAEQIVDVAREAAAKGSTALIVVSGEIADQADQAREREQRLLEVLRDAGTRLVGPDCLGVLNTDPRVSLNATSAGFRVPAGRLAICSESGAIGISLLGHSAARRLESSRSILHARTP